MEQGRLSDFRRINFMLMSISGLYHEAVVRFGLTDSVALILHYLDDHGDHCPLSSIYKNTGIRKQTVNSSIRKLEADGVLYLEQDTGRSKRVVLTDKGRQLVENTVSQIRKAEVHALDDWSREEIHTYILTLTKVAESLKQALDRLDYPD